MCVCLVLRILHIEEEKTSKLHNWFQSYKDFTNIFSSCWFDPQGLDVPADRVSRGRS